MAAHTGDFGGLREALGRLLGVPVEVFAQPPRQYALHEIPNLAGPAGESAVAVHVQASGVMQGHLLLLLPPRSARSIGDLMLGPGAPSELVLDACRELANIIGSRYLSWVADEAGGRATPTTPRSTVDMAGAVISAIVQAAGVDAPVQAIEMKMQTEEETIHATLLVLQDQGAGG